MSARATGCWSPARSGGVGFFADPDRRRARRRRSWRRRARATTASSATPAPPRCYDYSAGPISEQLTEPVDAVLDLVGGDALADAPKQVRDPFSRIALIVNTAAIGF